MTRRLCSIVLALHLAAGVAVAADAPPSNAQKLYGKYCAQCHGDAGDGKGHAAARVKPAPRDFTSGKYKVRTTPSGSLPTDADIARSIRDGFPYTSMPAWPNFTDEEVAELVGYLKSFAPRFADPENKVEPIDIPEPPDSSPDSIAKGKQIYEQLECARCHGELGRGDGPSAPTLVDDWGQHIRPADMSMRWTFRGGASRQDMFRTFSTGLNGTPMPSYADSLAVEDRWHLVNYMDSLAPSSRPGYTTLLVAAYVEDELDLAKADELFSAATASRIPLVGQIMEPGRNFFPSTTSLVARAVYNRKEIAIEVRWNDMRADKSGTSAPDLAVPLEEEAGPNAPPGASGEGAEDFWGEEAAAQEAAPPAAEEDFWGEEPAQQAAAPASGGSEFADAVAIQVPVALPAGALKPYFIFGDAENAVDLWFLDLATGTVRTYLGRGSASVVASAGDDIEVTSGYDRGEWRAIFKRSLRSTSGLSFAENQFVPVAYSVWDGFNRERGNKRALSVWSYVFLQPSEKMSVAGPVARVALSLLALELLVIFLVRKWHAGSRAGSPRHESDLAEGARS